MKWSCALALGLASAVVAGNAEGQVVRLNLGNLNPGFNRSVNLNFTSPSQFFVGVGNLRVDALTGSGHGLIFDTIGGVPGEPDTEIAIYDATTMALVACNDDAADSIQDSLNSYVAFGDAAGAADNNAGYNGYTNQSFDSWINPTELNAGPYLFIVATYSTVWDQFDARDTTYSDFRDLGSSAVAHLEVF